ncbi:MAG: hypothetical protein KJ697_01660 [Nanoarchaeota archaeon]|nr:hypothetical protein [Nanoarchaeota archaeon]
MKVMLVTRPRYDDATEYLFYYAGLILNESGSRGIPFIDLKRPKLTKNTLTAIVKEKKPELVFFNGHGDEKTIYGDKVEGNEENLVSEGENDWILKSRITYARACNAANSLGKKCADGCFIGYNNPFCFWIDDKWSAKPSNDNTAKLFLEPSNVIISSLLKGNTGDESVEKSVQLSKKNMLKLLKDKEEPGAVQSIMLIWNNMEGLSVIGNGNMKFN